MEYIQTTLVNLLQQTAFLNLTFGNLIMIFVAFLFLYLAIRKGFEPLLLVPISFGMLLVNIYPDIMLTIEDSSNGVGGLLHYFYLLDEWSILPSLIFMGVGAMTDFGPLIANPKSFLLGAAAQFGIYAAYFLAIFSLCLSVKASEFISLGYTGKDIGIKMHEKRVELVKDFMKMLPQGEIDDSLNEMPPISEFKD